MKGVHWTEPTSFFLLSGMYPLRRVVDAIKAKSLIDETKDLVFVMMVKTGQSAVIGKPKDPATLNRLRGIMAPKAAA